jgi:hypothetical protein
MNCTILGGAEIDEKDCQRLQVQLCQHPERGGSCVGCHHESEVLRESVTLSSTVGTIVGEVNDLRLPSDKGGVKIHFQNIIKEMRNYLEISRISTAELLPALIKRDDREAKLGQFLGALSDLLLQSDKALSDNVFDPEEFADFKRSIRSVEDLGESLFFDHMKKGTE